MPDENKVNELATEQARLREQVKGLEDKIIAALKRLDEQNKLALSVQDLALSVRDLANEQKNTSCAVTALRADVDVLKQKPAKRWDNASTVVVTALITAVIAFILSKIGLK